MIRNEFHIKADLKLKKYSEEPTFKANDSVLFVVSVTDKNTPVTLEGVERVEIAHVRPDKKVVRTPGEIMPGGEIHFTLDDSEATTIEGQVRATVQLFDAENRVSTVSFTYTVERDPDSFHIPNKRDRTLIELALQDGPLALAEMQRETLKAETVTKAATVVLESTEAERLATQAERLKTASEREETESIRLLTEETKETTDAVRLSTEQVSARAETAAAEAERVRTETETVKGETIQAKTEAIEAAAFADNIRINTELERLATQKVKEETALTKAAADTAAATANEKANYANAQGDFAKEQAAIAKAEAAAAAEQKEVVGDIIKSGPVASVNGKVGMVSGLAEQSTVEALQQQVIELSTNIDGGTFGDAYTEPDLDGGTF